MIHALLCLSLIVLLVALTRCLLFHPLRHIPGPRTATLFSLHEFYHNILRDGEWSQTFPSLHQYYSMPPLQPASLISVSAHRHQTHPSSALARTTIYRLGTAFPKDAAFYTSADNHGSIFSMCDRAEHRQRRKALAPRFSTQAAELAAPGIVAELRALIGFMLGRSRSGEGCNISDLFRVLAINWVADTLLGNSGRLVEYQAAKPEMLQDIDGLSAVVPLLQFLPYLPTLNSLLPSLATEYLTPAGVGRFKKVCKDTTRPLLSTPVKDIASKPQASVVELLIAHRRQAHGKQPTLDYLAEEAFTFIDAGVDTTGGTLVTAVYHILRNPGILHRLRSELDDAWLHSGGEVDTKILAGLPYLNAIIQESHRIWPAIPGPLPRVVPSGGLQVGSYFIPGGTIISSTHYSLHYNETVFPAPQSFNPERWLQCGSGSGNGKWAGERYLNPYSRGSRACLGINLAQMQLRLALSHLFRSYELELCEPVPEGREWRDHFVARAKWPVLVRIWPREGTF
ncbi:cytochrome P450 [Aspergillus egyptiacus]|nr:cytochrome P450 [Aspergillus egyptiacus]